MENLLFGDTADIVVVSGTQKRRVLRDNDNLVTKNHSTAELTGMTDKTAKGSPHPGGERLLENL